GSVITKLQDIYNAYKKLYHEYLQGKMPIQALLDDLKKGPFEYDFICDLEGLIMHLFISHNQSIELTQGAHSVLKQYIQIVLQQTRAHNKLSKIIKEQPMHLLDPTVAHTRKRPIESRNNTQTSTQRIPLAFELEESKTTSRKCDIYYNIGHNSRTCSSHDL
ncbi:25026_t:CDS:2, partial [Cetraspora pellucida]